MLAKTKGAGVEHVLLCRLTQRSLRLGRLLRLLLLLLILLLVVVRRLLLLLLLGP